MSPKDENIDKTSMVIRVETQALDNKMLAEVYDTLVHRKRFPTPYAKELLELTILLDQLKDEE